MNTAYELGWLAAERGVAMKDCPFPSQGARAMVWRAGWRDAHSAVGL
jgi:ribosome modulation factor